MQDASREALPYEVISQFAQAAGAVECHWRISDRSFSGYVAEVWFGDLKMAAEFARVCSDRMGVICKIRATSDGPAKFYVSVPCL
ncbi:hypothetical protein [Aerosakkonema funiforme]|uniref:hypothetical protein n=1 Tax=Aerosakkonema funiforme TaxID=1246630 RepID=UPI0035B8550E